MGFFKKKHIYLLINDRGIRYLVCPNTNGKNKLDYGELFFDGLVIEDGKIIALDQLTQNLKTLVNKKKWKNADVSFILPDTFVTMRKENIPSQLDKEEAKKYIRLQLEGSIRLPFKDPAIDFELLKQGDKENEILLFAYPKERLKPFYNLFNDISLNPVVADVSFLSVYRAYQDAYPVMDNEHLIIIQWNKTELVLTIFNHEQPIFNRHMHASNAMQGWKLDESKLNLVSTETSEQREESRDNAMISIERFMDFYQYSITNGEHQVTDVFLVGDHPDLDVMKKDLDSRFDLEIKTLDVTNDLPTAYASLYGLRFKKEQKRYKKTTHKKSRKKDKQSDVGKTTDESPVKVVDAEQTIDVENRG